MHEITKYFLFTENQEQCLNPSYPTHAAMQGQRARSEVRIYLDFFDDEIAARKIFLLSLRQCNFGQEYGQNGKFTASESQVNFGCQKHYFLGFKPTDNPRLRTPLARVARLPADCPVCQRLLMSPPPPAVRHRYSRN